MRKVFLIIFIFISFNVQAQIDSARFHKCFKEKLISGFKTLNPDLNNSERDGRIYFEHFSDIVDNYQGGKMVIIDSRSCADGSCNRCDVYFISKGDSIIYYYMQKDEPYHKIWFRNLFGGISDFYINEEQYRQLKKRFKQTFGSQFLDSIFFDHHTFGSACQLVGSDPKPMKVVKRCVATKDVKKLLLYLTSSNTTLQLYGYYGFYLLHKKEKINLPENVRVIMNIIENKNGEIETCGGCIFDTQEIKWIIENIIKKDEL